MIARQTTAAGHTTPSTKASGRSNGEIARELDRLAELLEAQCENPYRVQAYRAAAETVRTLAQPVHALLTATGVAGLIRLRTIGESLARTIAQLDAGDTTPLLAQLRGETSPEQIFTTVPGIGPELASRIHDMVGIETLADLHMAAHDGRLERIDGFGPRRLRGVREALAGRFRHGPRWTEADGAQTPSDQIGVGDLLDIDQEYRQSVTAGTLRRDARQRYNPTRAAWLPVLHTRRGAAHYTARWFTPPPPGLGFSTTLMSGDFCPSAANIASAASRSPGAVHQW